MKKSILLFVLLPFLVNNIFAQERKVKSKVISATVFSRGAQITRIAKFNLEKGENSVVFTNLPPLLDESSIQINCDEATIISVSHQKNMLDSLTQNPDYLKLQNRKKELALKLKLENALFQSVVNEKNILHSNEEWIGDQGIKLEDLKNAMIYFRSKAEEIERILMDKSKVISDLEEEQRKIDAQLQTLYVQNRKNTTEVFVNFNATQPVAATAEIKYFTLEAYWSPTYDVRVNSINEPLSITYKANVLQTTGEDWKKVKLSVSSGNPTSGSTTPSIYPWYLDFVRPVIYNDISEPMPQFKSEAEQREVAIDEVAVMGYGAKKKDADKNILPVSVSESQTNFTYNIDIPYDIPSKQQPTIAVLHAPTIKAAYQYNTIPKFSEYAYLVANLTDWQDLNLLDGNANLYFENNYVGTTYLDTKAFGDTLKLSLGKDESISVKRTKVKTFTEKNLIGSKVTETRSWEISITNGKKQDIDLTIEDQMPVSTNEKIKVKPLEQGGSNYTMSSGILKWNIKFKPAETKKLQFSYSVEYPKGNQVMLE